MAYFQDRGYLVLFPQWNFDSTPIIVKCCSNYQTVTPQRQILEDNSCLNLNFHSPSQRSFELWACFSPWSHSGIGPLSTSGVETARGFLGGRICDDTRKTEGRGVERWGSAAVKRDESVDKVKLEIRRTDGAAKNVTCQVACGTAGGGIGRHLQSGDKKGGRVRMTDALWGRATEWGGWETTRWEGGSGAGTEGGSEQRDDRAGQLKWNYQGKHAEEDGGEELWEGLQERQGEERVDGGGVGAKSKGRGGSFLPSSDSHAKQCRAHQSVATSRRRGSGKVRWRGASINELLSVHDSRPSQIIPSQFPY